MGWVTPGWMIAALLLASLALPATAQVGMITLAEAQPEPLRPLITEGGSTVPIPDPTVLTVNLLNREIERLKDQMAQADTALRQLMDERFSALAEVVDLRDEKVNDAIDTRNGIVTSNKTEAEDRIAGLQAVITERFNRVDDGFANVERKFQAVDKNVDTALKFTQGTANDALTAAKEQVKTAAVVTEKQITEQGKLLNEVTNGLRTSVDDLKKGLADMTGRVSTSSEVNLLAQRLTSIEARNAGLGEAKTNLTDNVGMLGVIIGAGLGVTGLIFGATRKPEIDPHTATLLQQVTQLLGQQRAETITRYVQAPLPPQHGVVAGVV